MERKREIDWRPALWSAALALVLYCPTLFGTYVFDDRYIVQLDPRVSDPMKWPEYWTKDYFNGGVDNLYRPLVSMSYAIQAYLHGNGDNRAWLFHLVNILLHAAVSGCVAEFTRRISSVRIALIAGLLFAAHPIHVEAVANIVGRAELMCALGIASALMTFMNRPMTIARAIDIWAWFVLALLSKEQGMLLPLALVIAWPLRGRFQPAGGVEMDRQGLTQESAGTLAYQSPDLPRRANPERRPLLWLTFLLCSTLAGYIVFREHILKFWWDRAFLDPSINPLVQSTGIHRWLAPLALLGRYIVLLIAPVNLSLDYGAQVIPPTVSPADPYLYVGIIAALGWVIAVLVCLYRRRWLAASCLLLFALFYSVVSNGLTIIGVNFAERLMYIPSIFFIILVARLLASLRRRLMIAFVSIILVLFSLRTVTYALQWNDRLRLYEYSLARQPQSLRLHLLLAEELRLRAQYDRAEEILNRAREMDPGYWRLWHDAAVNQFAKGDYARAEQYALRAAELRPSFRSSKIYRDIVDRATTQPASKPSAR